jgi:hypothetical protein
MDPYKARKDATEKLLLEEPEAQSHNSDICESDANICESDANRSDTGDNAYVPSDTF